MAIKKVKIEIRTLEETLGRFAKVAKEIDNGIFRKHTPTISFADFEVYKKSITPKRLELIQTIRLKKPENINNLAKIAHRDFKNVYDDVKILEKVGLIKLKKTSSGLMPSVLYDEIQLNIKIPLIA